MKTAVCVFLFFFCRKFHLEKSGFKPVIKNKAVPGILVTYVFLHLLVYVRHKLLITSVLFGKTKATFLINLK